MTDNYLQHIVPGVDVNVAECPFLFIVLFSVHAKLRE